MARRKKKTTRRRAKPMIRVMPMLEAYAIANVATKNLMGGSPIQVLLGDLNQSVGSANPNALQLAMGPQPGVLTIKELLTGTMNESGYTTGMRGQQVASIVTSATTPLDHLAQNFQDNFGNIVVGSVMTTAGFRIANKVLAKPKNKLNKMLRNAGLGTTVQI